MNLMTKKQLEDLKVFFDNVKICRVQLRLIILSIFCITIIIIILAWWPFCLCGLNLYCFIY